MAVAKLMTNILPEFYNFLEKEGSRLNKTKREIIEEALQLYIKNRKKKLIEKHYKAMFEDIVYLEELRTDAESGMEYFLEDTAHAD